MSPKPPEILRKSHRRADRKERATVNLKRLEMPPQDLPAPQPISYAVKTREQRIRRG